MSIITYPLEDIEYDAAAAEGYLSTRYSGVFSDENQFTLSLNGSRSISIGSGHAWIKDGNFKGKSIISYDTETLEVPVANGELDRFDLVALRFDKGRNESFFLIKEGAPSSTPQVPSVIREGDIFELGLYKIFVPAQSVDIQMSNVTSLMLDENYCGLMRDGVERIPTDELLRHANEKIDELNNSIQAAREEIEILGTGYGAYAAAIDGGYSGTQEDFYRQLSGVDKLPVSINVNGNWTLGGIDTGVSAIGLTAYNPVYLIQKYTEAGAYSFSCPKEGRYIAVIIGGGGSGCASKGGLNIYRMFLGGNHGNVSICGKQLTEGEIVNLVVGSGGEFVTAESGDNNQKIVYGNNGGTSSFGDVFAEGGEGGKFYSTYEESKLDDYYSLTKKQKMPSDHLWIDESRFSVCSFSNGGSVIVSNEEQPYTMDDNIAAIVNKESSLASIDGGQPTASNDCGAGGGASITIDSSYNRKPKSASGTDGGVFIYKVRSDDEWS